MEIRDFVGKFVAVKLRLGVKRQQVWAYDRAVGSFLQMFPDKHEPNDFTQFDVAEYARVREQSSVSRAHYDVAAISVFWNWLNETCPEWAIGNPARGVLPQIMARRPPVDHSKYRAFTTEEWACLRKVCHQPSHRLLLALGSLGLTQEEVAGLTRSSLLNGCIPLPDRTLQIDLSGLAAPHVDALNAEDRARQEKREASLERMRQRLGRDRLVPLGDGRYECIKAGSVKLEETEEEPIELSTLPLFRGKGKDSVRLLWGQVAKAASLEWSTSNSNLDNPPLAQFAWQRLRRSFVCRLLLAGASIAQVARLLGLSEANVSRLVQPAAEPADAALLQGAIQSLQPAVVEMYS